MTAPNWKSRTVWTGDCLYVLRGMNSESVNLIYLDPPFNSKANYAAPIGSRAAGAAFTDTWALSDVDVEWINLIEGKHPALYRVLLAATTPSDKSYLTYMAARLLEMRRVLKSTGSIWLHCDPTMSHYLKLVMDAIFGRDAFRNEVIWKRTSSHSDAKRMGSVHDTVLVYAISPKSTFNSLYRSYDSEYIRKRFRHHDADGRRWMDDNLTAKGLQGGGYEYEYKGAHSLWRVSEDRMRELDAANRLYFTRSGGIRIKRYLDQMKGVAVSDLWTDVPPINSQATERTGYPTQKPLALLERVIRASSNQDDMVLDPFCGCATTMVAAETLGRKWAGVDLSPLAVRLVGERLREQHGIFGEIIARKDIPRRTDFGRLPPVRTHLNPLYGEQGGDCAGCGEHFKKRHLEIDHIVAKSKGGTDHIENLQLLCGACNKVKGNRGMAYLRTKLQLPP